jgi:sugar phosphate permease
MSFDTLTNDTPQNGVGGKAAWAWIFILEGIMSILVSIIAYWCIHDYPAT